MMMLRIAFFLIASTLAFAQTVENTKTAKIVELFRLTKTEQMQKQILSQMTSGLDPQARQSSQKMMDFLAQKMSWEAMKSDYIKMYDDTYTEEEISGILLFYQSASGQAFLAKSPVLMTNMMALVQKRMAEIKPEMDRIIRESAQKQ